jgi:hypothetical protein
LNERQCRHRQRRSNHAAVGPGLSGHPRLVCSI